ncbi:EAL domain-containing protein [Rheinheimera sp. UJ63]|uniref:EAL domain-containing protein n=1 Tax=Rheinheimera sp. UJ63 TaxID=2910157 RepID=UPI001F1EAACE|nr:EAL domain-containing protein [Rheinheimera sp. UJ63]MCF4010325.1 EAL domain-containing protein [Rheinheimera sp. UJ63]
MKWLLTVFLLLFTSLVLNARTQFMPLTPEQGLSQGAVRKLHLDKDGFLWLATAGGINRFDGNNVHELHAKQYRLSEIAFSELLEDSQGRLWASANHTGLYLLDPAAGQFELFFTPPRKIGHPIESTIMSVIERDADRLLLVVNDAVYQLQLSDKSWQKIFDLTQIGQDQGWIRHIALQQQQLFIGAFNGLILFDLQSNEHHYIPYLPANQASINADQSHVKSLLLSDDQLYVGTVSGLFQLPLTAISAYVEQGTPIAAMPMLAEHNIWKLKTHDNHVWIGTDQGLYQLALSAKQPELALRFSDSDLLIADNSVIDFVHDKQNGIWLASREDGAYYWHPKTQAFRYLAASQGSGFSSDRTTQLWQQDQYLWLSSFNGLNRYNLATDENQSFLATESPYIRMRESHIHHFLPGSQGELWLQVSMGIRRFDTQTLSVSVPSLADSSQQKLLASGAKLELYHAADNSLIISQQKNLYRYHIDTGHITSLEQLNQQLPMAYWGRILGQLPDQSWLLSLAGQLWHYQPDTEKLRLIYQHSDYQPQLNRYATSMQIDHNGTLWVGMRGIGLLSFNLENLTLQQLFSVDNKLMSNEVFSLQLDDAGDLWFASRKGLFRLEHDNLQLEFFNQADGLAFNEFYDGATTKLADGRLVYGGMRGAIIVEPKLLTANTAPLKMTITEFNVLSGKPQTIQGQLNNRQFQLSHNDTGLKIHFSAMSFHNNHKIAYRYWLTGQQNNIYPEQFTNQVLFPQLPPGHYQFYVSAIAPLTGEQSAPASLSFIIEPPLWRSTPAYFMYALLFGSIFLLYWRKRRQQQSLLRQANRQIQLSEQRLTQALASVNGGVFEWLAKHNHLVSNRYESVLGFENPPQSMHLEQHCQLIHQDDRQEFLQQWRKLLDDPSFMLDVTYRIQHQDSRWLWFRDQARVTAVDDDNKPKKILGTFSNITETKANKEKARLFGEAFQQTRDWVVILDTQQRIIAANHSFAQAFGSVDTYVDTPRVHHLGISLVRRRFYTRLLRSMQKGEHWQGEERVITPDGKERPTLINISAVGEQGLSFFVLVFTDITAQKAAEAELRYLANYDALTGLPNRALLMDRIMHGIDKTRREQRSLALYFIDLDRFKHINDSLGHDIGDLMLKEVARRLKLTLRDTDTVARLGGDEFVVLLEGYKSADNLSHVARKMLAVISEPMQLGSENIGVSPSIGIAVFPDDALNGTELMKHADVAMYHAKEAGRNNFQFFMKAMNEKAHMQLARESRLRKAVQKQEFINYYQPIIDANTNRLVGAEVLLRWQSPDGMISPADFIPLAEDLRLIVNMTQQLIERALQDMVSWRADKHEVYLSINLSTQHLEQPKLAETVIELLNKYQLPVQCLRFEITESALMRDQQSAILTMQSLSDAGIKLALDDFGTGYSSLKYLKELPLDAIKIDRSFVQDIGVDHNDEAIIDAMLSMSYSLGLYCVAEGVETEQQLSFFRQRNCSLIQGFLFSKPLPNAEFIALLNSGRFAG